MRRTIAFTTASALVMLLWAPTSLAAGEEIDRPPEPPQEICLHPVGAILCLGAAVLVFAGCGFGFSCTGEGPSSDPSNPPDSSGGGQQGQGDGAGDSEGKSGGGSDD